MNKHTIMPRIEALQDTALALAAQLGLVWMPEACAFAARPDGHKRIEDTEQEDTLAGAHLLARPDPIKKREPCRACGDSGVQVRYRGLQAIEYYCGCPYGMAERQTRSFVGKPAPEGERGRYQIDDLPPGDYYEAPGIPGINQPEPAVPRPATILGVEDSPDGILAPGEDRFPEAKQAVRDAMDAGATEIREGDNAWRLEDGGGWRCEKHGVIPPGQDNCHDCEFPAPEEGPNVPKPPPPAKQPGGGKVIT